MYYTWPNFPLKSLHYLIACLVSWNYDNCFANTLSSIFHLRYKSNNSKRYFDRTSNDINKFNKFSFSDVLYVDLMFPFKPFISHQNALFSVILSLLMKSRWLIIVCSNDAGTFSRASSSKPPVMEQKII